MGTRTRVALRRYILLLNNAKSNVCAYVPLFSAPIFLYDSIPTHASGPLSQGSHWGVSHYYVALSCLLTFYAQQNTLSAINLLFLSLRCPSSGLALETHLNSLISVPGAVCIVAVPFLQGMPLLSFPNFTETHYGSHLLSMLSCPLG